MEQLKHDWLTDGLIDYEYKKYILLAYLKDVRRRFNKSQLYPFMADLVFHYRNLVKVKEEKQLLYENFPSTLTRADFQKLKLSYDKMIKDDDVMKVLEDIIAFALPLFQHTLDEGKELYEFVEENIELAAIGLTPIYTDEGYLLIHSDSDPDVAIFRYQLTFFERAEEKYQSLSTTFLHQETKSISYTYESMKLDLVKRFTDLPNPATYLAVSKFKFPLNSTILPVAKRMLARTINE